MSHLNSEQDW